MTLTAITNVLTDQNNIFKADLTDGTFDPIYSAIRDGNVKPATRDIGLMFYENVSLSRTDWFGVSDVIYFALTNPELASALPLSASAADAFAASVRSYVNKNANGLGTQILGVNAIVWCICYGTFLFALSLTFIRCSRYRHAGELVLLLDLSWFCHPTHRCWDIW